MASAEKKNTKYPVREPNADDAIELIGIISAAGGGDKIGEAVSIAVSAYQSNMADHTMRAAMVAISDGLHAALRDRVVREDAKEFIFQVWNPKLTVGEGETYERAKREAWEKLPMRAPMEIVNAFRQTKNFGDFLAFFTDLMPTRKASGESSTPSSESTGT